MSMLLPGNRLDSRAMYFVLAYLATTAASSSSSSPSRSIYIPQDLRSFTSSRLVLNQELTQAGATEA